MMEFLSTNPAAVIAVASIVQAFVTVCLCVFAGVSVWIMVHQNRLLKESHETQEGWTIFEIARRVMHMSADDKEQMSKVMAFFDKKNKD